MFDPDQERAFAELMASVGAPVRHPLVPELSIYNGSVLEVMWEAIEAHLGRRIDAPFWAFAWPGGLAVARHLLDHPELVRGRRVLDVGTGSGVIAVAVALAGGEVAANDIDPLALRAARLHAQAHGVQVAEMLGDLLDVDPVTLPFDLITVGDAFYEQPLAGRLHPWLRAAHRAGRDVLLGDPGRSFLPQDDLEMVAEYQVQTSLDLEGRPFKPGRIWRLK